MNFLLYSLPFATLVLSQTQISTNIVVSSEQECLLTGTSLWLKHPRTEKFACIEVPKDEKRCDDSSLFVWYDNRNGIVSCVVPPTTSEECFFVGGYEWRDGQCYPTDWETCINSAYHTWFNDVSQCSLNPTTAVDCARSDFFGAWTGTSCPYSCPDEKEQSVLVNNPITEKTKCVRVPNKEKDCKEVQSLFVWYQSTSVCGLPPNTIQGCALVENYEWREGHCFPATEKTCFLSPYHVWYKGETQCSKNPVSMTDCAKTEYFGWSASGINAAACHFMCPSEKKPSYQVYHPIEEVSDCYEVPKNENKCAKRHSPYIWYDDACLPPPMTAAACSRVEGYEWRDEQCFAATEKTCLLSPYYVWYINDPLNLNDTGACFTIPDNEIDCDKTAFFDWTSPDQVNFGCHYMSSCQDSTRRMWISTTVTVVDSTKGASKSSGSSTGMMQKRSILKKRSPKGTKDGAVDPKENKNGHCLAKPTKDSDCNNIGHGYFWDKLSGDLSVAVPECNFKTHCVTKRGIERDWINAECIIPKTSETGKGSCEKELDYDWYKAAGQSAAACHYKDRCKLEPLLDWILPEGGLVYGCHGAIVCNAKPNWHWNNVTWPQLYIASPYFDLAIEGFFICQPTTIAECDAQSVNNWFYWFNPDLGYDDCRINPTEREACLELPNLPYNDIIESQWTGKKCWYLEQATNENAIAKRSLFKRGMSYRDSTSLVQSGNPVGLWQEGWLTR